MLLLRLMRFDHLRELPQRLRATHYWRGEVPGGSHLKEKLGSIRFVYFRGITKQRTRGICKALSALKVDTKEVKGLLSTGKQVCDVDNVSIRAYLDKEDRIWEEHDNTPRKVRPPPLQQTKECKGDPGQGSRGPFDPKAACTTSQSDTILVP